MLMCIIVDSHRLLVCRIFDTAQQRPAKTFETGFVVLPANTFTRSEFRSAFEKRLFWNKTYLDRSLFRREDSCNLSRALWGHWVKARNQQETIWPSVQLSERKWQRNLAAGLSSKISKKKCVASNFFAGHV